MTWRSDLERSAAVVCAVRLSDPWSGGLMKPRQCRTR
jgi:hypothetical protein